MSLYKALSKIRFLRTYTSKFLFLAFVGIHLPLIGLAIFSYFFSEQTFDKQLVLAVTLIITLFSTIVTLYLIYHFLTPIRLASKSIKEYITKNKLPYFPSRWNDEIGDLLHSLQTFIHQLDLLQAEKEDVVEILSTEARANMKKLYVLTQELTEVKDFGRLSVLAGNIQQSVQINLNTCSFIMDVLQSDKLRILPLSLSLVPLRHHIQQSLNQYAVLIQQKDLIVQLKVDATLTVLVDWELFFQAIQNLIFYCIDHAPAAQTIRISERVAKDQLFINVGVIDEPLSQPNEAISFSKIEMESASFSEIQSIGIYMAQKILEKHEGSVDLYQAVKSRSMYFSLKFPYQSLKEKTTHN